MTFAKTFRERFSRGARHKSGGSVLKRTLAVLVVALCGFMAVTAFFTYRNARTDAIAARDATLAEVAASLARADVFAQLPEAPMIEGGMTEASEELLKAFPPHPEGAAQGMPRGMMGMGMGMGMGRMHGRMGRHRMHGMDNNSCSTDEEAEGIVGRILPEAEKVTVPAGEELLIRLRQGRDRAAWVQFGEDLHGGFSTVSIAGDPHRLCLLVLPDGRYTAVADSIAAIEESAQKAALDAVKPLLILLPLLVLVVAVVLRITFRPLARAAEDVRSRDENHWTPISVESVPVETRPFVEAVNDLLDRVEAARLRELRFSADAAHELRSPLTSLTIEAEHLDRLPLSPEAKPVVANLRQGLERAVHQVSQLLQFARAQAGETQAVVETESPWYLSELIGRLIEPLLNAAEEKRLEWDIEGLEDEAGKEVPVEGVPSAAVEAILRNLMENAVRYSPEGGRISVRVERSGSDLRLSVVNDGPGIPEAERTRVFDPFYRIAGTGVPGTGLGLAIVKTYADRIGATVTLSDAHPGADERAKGLVAAVSIPQRKKA